MRGNRSDSEPAIPWGQQVPGQEPSRSLSTLPRQVASLATPTIPTRLASPLFPHQEPLSAPSRRTSDERPNLPSRGVQRAVMAPTSATPASRNEDMITLPRAVIEKYVAPANLEDVLSQAQQRDGSRSRFQGAQNPEEQAVAPMASMAQPLGGRDSSVALGTRTSSRMDMDLVTLRWGSLKDFVHPNQLLDVEGVLEAPADTLQAGADAAGATDWISGPKGGFIKRAEKEILRSSKTEMEFYKEEAKDLLPDLLSESGGTPEEPGSTCNIFIWVNNKPRPWPAIYRYTAGRHKLQAGWGNLVKDNKLQPGDKFVIERRTEDRHFLNMTVVSRRENRGTGPIGRILATGSIGATGGSGAPAAVAQLAALAQLAASMQPARLRRSKCSLCLSETVAVVLQRSGEFRWKATAPQAGSRPLQIVMRAVAHLRRAPKQRRLSVVVASRGRSVQLNGPHRAVLCRSACAPCRGMLARVLAELQTWRLTWWLVLVM